MDSQYSREELREISQECRKAEREYYFIKGVTVLVVCLSAACAIYMIHLYHVRPPGRYIARIPFLFLLVVIGVSFWLMYFIPRIHKLWDRVMMHRMKKNAARGMYGTTLPPEK